MVKYHLFLDRRREGGAGMSQVKLYVYTGGRASFVATGVSIPAQWWSADAQAVSARAIGAEALNAQLRDVLDIARRCTRTGISRRLRRRPRRFGVRYRQAYVSVVLRM